MFYQSLCGAWMSVVSSLCKWSYAHLHCVVHNKWETSINLPSSLLSTLCIFRLRLFFQLSLNFTVEKTELQYSPIILFSFLVTDEKIITTVKPMGIYFAQISPVFETGFTDFLNWDWNQFLCWFHRFLKLVSPVF